MVVAAAPVVFARRLAARPVGAMSMTRAPRPWYRSRMQLMMVVLPVPGPPVMTSTFSFRAAATAWACSGGELKPLPGLDLADQVVQVQRWMAAPAAVARRPRVWATPVSATQAARL